MQGGDVAGEAGVGVVGVGFEEDVFVGAEFGVEGREGGVGDREAFVGIEAVDEGPVDADFAVAGVEGFVVDFLGFEVLGSDAEGVGFDTGVDIFGDEEG